MSDDRMHWTVTALVAGASLVAGFGVAELTGVRAIGGAVLIAAVAWCVPRIRPGRRWMFLLVYALAFVGSHALGPEIGAWIAVLVAAGVVALATEAVA
jgi:hypothetical protein